MKKILIFALALLLHFNTTAQVGVGTTIPDGALDVSSSNDGLLLPRIALTATNVATVITPTISELVYNTATSAVGPNQVTPGFYYWNGTLWVRLATGSTNDWALTGNSGTTPGTNFLGTTDAQDLRIKTGGNDRLNILNSNGQLQSYFAGTNTAPAFSWNEDPNTGVFRSAADNLGLTTNGVEGLRVRENSNVSIGGTYASTNAAPTNGLRVQGKTVIGKASGEDTRDIFSSHTSAAAYNNVTGYPGVTESRAISGYANNGGMGVFGFADRNGYGVVGLTQASAISGFVQTGEGVLGQADGSSGVTSIPIGVHGIIDEATSGLNTATPILGENNNIIRGTGLGGGAYNGTSPAVAGVYGNIGTRTSSSTTDAYQFGVIGDILLLGVASQPDATGGVLGTNASGDFGILGYKSTGGTFYSGYFGSAGGVVTGTGRISSNSSNGNIGIGVNGGFMGGYVKGSEYGLISSGDEFGMYVQGNTITNAPIVQLTETSNSQRTISYTATSTEIDVTTRGVGNLTNGESYVSFKDAFKNLVSNNEPINITITPTGETNGVYVSKVTSEGFYVKENRNGNSNVSFNWTAIGTRKGYENGVEISDVVLSNNFDKNMNGVMNNDGSKEEGTPIYYDGNQVRFERMPESMIQYNKKEAPKKK
ncbi:hypothetical protein [Flavobacterium sp.]|uniref:hypothetical protein n=2 Tax=Flavobacterium sp. TaxID=239 RepID=UPI0040487D8F